MLDFTEGKLDWRRKVNEMKRLTLWRCMCKTDLTNHKFNQDT